MQISGVYDLNKRSNLFLNCDGWYRETENCSAAVLCNTQYTNPLELVEFVKNSRRQKISVDGLFLAVIYYQHRLYVFADQTTSQWVFYYTIYNNKFIYSTSLKELLSNSNILAAKGFVHNGIVIVRQTLVEDVYKLDCCEFLQISGKEILHRSLRYSNSFKHSELDLIPTLRRNVKKYVKNLDRVSMPLSGGYDSNLILDTIGNGDISIDTYTIGGATGKNEIPLVKENIQFYPNISHHPILADETLFALYPEIIWRLDGYVYERGIFLQYLMAKSVSENDGKTMICGECSDEHQCLLYKKELKRSQHRRSSPLETLDWVLQPYTWGNQVVLKKSSLMLNSFGIESCYPFATKSFTDVAITQRKKNLDKKELYIRLLKDELPEKIYNNLVHAGGSTSIETIVSEDQHKHIRNLIATNELVNQIKSVREKCFKPEWLNFAEFYLNDGGKMTKKLIWKEIKLGIKTGMQRLGIQNRDYITESDGLETDLKYYYLMLFQKMFILGECEDL